jgi:hypothetical protein
MVALRRAFCAGRGATRRLTILWTHAVSCHAMLLPEFSLKHPQLLYGPVFETAQHNCLKQQKRTGRSQTNTDVYVHKKKAVPFLY